MRDLPLQKIDYSIAGLLADKSSQVIVRMLKQEGIPPQDYKIFQVAIEYFECVRKGIKAIKTMQVTGTTSTDIIKYKIIEGALAKREGHHIESLKKIDDIVDNFIQSCEEIVDEEKRTNCIGATYLNDFFILLSQYTLEESRKIQ